MFIKKKKKKAKTEIWTKNRKYKIHYFFYNIKSFLDALDEAAQNGLKT